MWDYEKLPSSPLDGWQKCPFFLSLSCIILIFLNWPSALETFNILGFHLELQFASICPPQRRYMLMSFLECVKTS